jgi:hypothetical protein
VISCLLIECDVYCYLVFKEQRTGGANTCVATGCGAFSRCSYV